MNKPKFFDTKAHIMICVSRDCSQRGSRMLYQAVWNALEREGLAYYKTGGSLRLTESGCLGACQYGPNLTCYFKQDGELHQAWYARQDFAQVLKIARALHGDEALPEHGCYYESATSATSSILTDE